MALVDVDAIAPEPQPEKPWPRVVQLKHPVTLGAETVNALTFRRGRLGDIKGMKIDDVPPAEQIMQLASRMCGQPIKVIESLDAEDASEVLEIALGFFAACLQGGPKR